LKINPLIMHTKKTVYKTSVSYETFFSPVTAVYLTTLRAMPDILPIPAETTLMEFDLLKPT
ncbi:TPA: hypothetical protein ACG1QI_003598, partial [Enterobacter kobei]